VASLVAHSKTSLAPEDALVRAVQFFSTEKWRVTSQSARAATFIGGSRVPWFMLLLTMIATMAFVIPGLILYFVVIRRMYRFQNLVVTTQPISGGSEVTVQYPPAAKKLADRYLEALPPFEQASIG
jgi:hypothetical protein